MSKSWKELIYPHLPVALQNVACGLQGRGQRRLRYGGRFSEVMEWLEESQWWSEAKVREHQSEQLEKLIRHAYETVPYYKDLFDRIRLKPADIKSPEDLYKIPVLTKEDVRNNYERMVSREFSPKGLVFCHTSGTTGKSLKFYQEPHAIRFRWAVWWRHKARFGVKFDEPYATFTGLTAIPINQTRPPFWRENRPMRQTVFTMHHIVESKVESIVARLNEGGFVYYAGYPSILYVLAALVNEKGLKVLTPPKYIFTGAENLYDNQRALISKALRSSVTDQYGFSEGCGNASRCEHDLFHEDFEFGVLECGDAETIDPITRRGRIIATGFSSYAMPFIRYEVGDVGTWKEVSCACGRKSKVLSKIDGRVEDFVITPEGHKILRFDYVFKDAENVRDAQVVQKATGSICLRIVRRPAYSVKDEDLLREEVRDRVSPMLLVTFEYVDEIERESNGKIRAVKSLLGSQIETSHSTL